MPDARAIFARIAAAAAAIVANPDCGAMFPPLSVASADYPKEWSPNAGPRLRARVQAVAARHGLMPRQIAYALCMTTGRLIARGKAVFDPRIAFRLAVEIMFGTARMVPLSRPL